MADLKIFGAPPSSYTWTVRIALAEKGVDFDFVQTPPNTDEQRALLERRGHLSPEEIHRLASKTKNAVGAEGGKAACHSDVLDDSAARAHQQQKLVQLGTKSKRGPTPRA